MAQLPSNVASLGFPSAGLYGHAPRGFESKREKARRIKRWVIRKLLFAKTGLV